jgi:predicted nucleic acid-binding protein
VSCTHTCGARPAEAPYPRRTSLSTTYRGNCATFGGTRGFAAIVPLHDDLSTSAITLLRRHPLRTLDALQLASALAVQSINGGGVRFAVLDERLRRAAASEGFTLAPA